MGKPKENPIQAAVQAGVAKARAVLEERDRIRAAIARTESQFGAGKAAEEVAVKAVAAEETKAALMEAGQALGEKPARGVERQADRRLEQVQKDQRLLNMRLEGLQARLVQSDELLFRAEKELESARAAWKTELVQQFSIEFEAAAAVFRKVILRGIALGDAINASAMKDDLETIEVRTFDGKKKLIGANSVKVNGGTTHPAWRDDPAALASHDGHSEPRMLAEKIARELRPLHARQAVERAAEATRKQQADAAAERQQRREREEQERLAALEKEKAAKAAAGAAPWYGVGIRVRSPGQLVR